MDQLRRLHLIGILKGIGGEEDRNRLGEEQLQRKLKIKEIHGERRRSRLRIGLAGGSLWMPYAPARR